MCIKRDCSRYVQGRTSREKAGQPVTGTTCPGAPRKRPGLTKKRPRAEGTSGRRRPANTLAGSAARPSTSRCPLHTSSVRGDREVIGGPAGAPQRPRPPLSGAQAPTKGAPVRQHLSGPGPSPAPSEAVPRVPPGPPATGVDVPERHLLVSQVQRRATPLSASPKSRPGRRGPDDDRGPRTELTLG